MPIIYNPIDTAAAGHRVIHSLEFFMSFCPAYLFFTGAFFYLGIDGDSPGYVIAGGVMLAVGAGVVYCYCDEQRRQRELQVDIRFAYDGTCFSPHKPQLDANDRGQGGDQLAAQRSWVDV